MLGKPAENEHPGPASVPDLAKVSLRCCETRTLEGGGLVSSGQAIPAYQIHESIPVM